MIYVKKLLATCAAIALAATSAIPLSAFADDPAGDALVFAIKTNKDSYKPGETAYVTLSIVSNPGVNGWVAGIDYDEGFVPVGSKTDFVTFFPDSDDGEIIEATYTNGAGKKVNTKVTESQFTTSDFDASKNPKTDDPFYVLWSEFSKKKGEVLGPNCPAGEENEGYAYKYTGDVVTLAFEVTENITDPNHAFSIVFDKDNPPVRGVSKEDGAVLAAEAENGGKANVTVEVPEEQVLVTGIDSERGTIELNVGYTATLKAKVTPDNATNKKLTWSSANTAIATVDSNGEVKGISEGQTIVTVASAENPEIKKEITVIVNAVHAESIALTLAKNEIDVGENTTSTVKFTPDDTTNKAVKYVSSNPAVATVDENTGAITGVGAGKATITATSVDNAEAKATAEITVKGLKLDEDVNEKGEVEQLLGDETIDFSADLPEGSTIEVTTDDPGVKATYDPNDKQLVLEGKPTKEKLTITVRLTLADGSVEEKTIEVVTVAPQVDIDVDSLTVGVGATTKLPYTIKYADDEEFDRLFEVRFVTLDKTIADIDTNANVTGVAKGNTSVGISVYSKDTESVVAEATVPVKVTKVDYKISFAEPEIDIKAGAKKELNFVIDPSNSETKDLLAELIEAGWDFTSSDPSVADVVDEQRMLKAYRQGRVVITATNPDYTDDEGNMVPVICVVNVISVFPAATPVNAKPSTDPVGRDKVTGYVNAIVDTNSTAAGPIAATGGDMTDTETSNAPAIAAAALGVIALGFVVVARKKRRS